MESEIFVELFQEALYLVVVMVSAIVLPGLVVGLLVSVFQAATSINEQTLSFFPRLLATLVAIAFFGHQFVQKLTEYFEQVLERIPLLLH